MPALYRVLYTDENGNLTASPLYKYVDALWFYGHFDNAVEVLKVCTVPKKRHWDKSVEEG